MADENGAVVQFNSIGDMDAALMKFLYENPDPAYGEFFKQAEERSGIKRERLAYGTLATFSLYLIVGQLAELVCNLIGFAYPAYASVKAIRTERKDDDTQLLIYWTAFALFSLVDFWAEQICRWFPIYWLVKMIFLLYLSAPQTRGAIKIYNNYVNPLVTWVDSQIAKYH